jgi:hypothetical protein
MQTDWDKFSNNIQKKNVDFFYCCDGDGIVEIAQKTDGGFSLYDQGCFVKRLSSKFQTAILQAEAYLKKHYEGIYNDNITQSLQVVLTADGKTQAFEMEVNEHGVPYFTDDVDLQICSFIGESRTLLTEMLEFHIYDGASVKGHFRGNKSETYNIKTSVSYVVLINGKKCKIDDVLKFCQQNAY